jgi:tetratricopeptide (TPR) repeat protein
MSNNYDISNDELTLINDNGDTTLFVKKESAKGFYKTGTKEKEAGNYDNAVASFTEAIRLDTNFVKAYTGRGEVYFAKEDYDNAISDYTETLRLNPKDMPVYLARVEAYSQKKDYEKAIADLELELQKADSASDEEKFMIAEGNTVDKKEFIKVLDERLEKNYILNIDPRLIGRHSDTHCNTWNFEKDGKGWVAGGCEIDIHFKFRAANGLIKFVSGRSCDEGSCRDVKMNDENFNFTDNGKTLILGKERFTKGRPCC